MLILLSIGSIGYSEEPDLPIPEEMPTPPSYQEGDEKETTVEIGQLRQALWYRNFSILTWNQLQTCEEAVDNQTDVAIKLAKQTSDLKDDLVNITIKYERLKNITLGVSIGAGALVTGVIIYALLSN